MEQEKITEEMHLEKGWYEEAHKQTLETLPSFMNHILNDYNHDYGTICYAIAACALAAIEAADNSEQGGITGFQASAIAWELMRQISFPYNKCGLKIIDFDQMLFPQYKYSFEKKEIGLQTWVRLKEEASKMLSDNKGTMSDSVAKHLESIVNGKVPFGYTVVDD